MRRQPEEIGPGIFMVAGPELTDSRDALAYLIADGDDLALIDAGAGPSYPRIIDHIAATGRDPTGLRLIIATHAHIDHIGALSAFVRDYAPAVVSHIEDAPAIETADPAFTAADWYGLTPQPVEVTVKLQGPVNRLMLGGSELVCLHTPGHTPGSMAVYLDRDGRRYLFGQDIHGPFAPSFGSDLRAWRHSMQVLLDLKADVLAEGHYGVYYGAAAVEDFIRGFLTRHSG